MARLAPGGKYLVSLEEYEKYYLTKIEEILSQGPDDCDLELIDIFCMGICYAEQGINQSQKQHGGKVVLMFNPDSRRLEVCHR